MAELLSEYYPNTKKIVKSLCKKEGFKSLRSEKLSKEERKNISQMICITYKHFSKNENREILLPISNLNISQDHNQVLFCMVSTSGKEIPVCINTQANLDSYLFQRRENVEAMKSGYSFLDNETGRYTASYTDSQTGEPKYFTFKDISSELE